MSVLTLLPVVVAYIFVHSSLVIGMLLFIVELKECGLGTQVSRTGLATIQVWNRIRAADLF